MRMNDAAAAQVAVGYALARRGLPAARSFRHWIDTALQLVQVRAVELAIQLVDEEQGRALNHQYRGRDYATNVLSFPAAPLPPGLPALPWRHLGDLVICAPVVAREAVEQGKQLNAHYAHMSVHGLLHLLGHDHEEEEQAQQMEALERSVLARLGWPDPYRLD